MKDDHELFKRSEEMYLVEVQGEARVEKQGGSKIQESLEC